MSFLHYLVIIQFSHLRVTKFCGALFSNYFSSQKALLFGKITVNIGFYPVYLLLILVKTEFSHY